MSILIRTFAAVGHCQFLEHVYVKIVAIDPQVGLTCDKWIYFVVCRVLMEMLQVEEPGLRVYNVCQVKFKDYQGADFLLQM